MIRSLTTLALLLLTASAVAQETHTLDAHEHGVSTAEIVLDDDRLVIDLYSPGMDIVGFEYQATADEDRAAVAQAVMQLSRADDIVTIDEAGGCLLIEVLSHLHGEDHEHEEAHGHEEGEEEHEAEETMAEDHGHDDETEHGEETHSEFHARYIYGCTDTSAIASIGFPFFEVFTNATEIEVQYVTAAGGGAGELERGDATLSIER